MTALSIHLPDSIAKASKIAARKLGLSRSEFIRQAILHELDNMQARLELEEMAKSFSAMKKHKDYLSESEEIENQLNDELPEEKEEWWKKK